MKDPNCIFCKIVDKKIPAHIVYEDADFLAFLDNHPQSPGHVQVVPKEHHRWVWDVPNVGEYFEVARKMALAQQKAFGNKWVLSRIDGHDVHHAHIWIYPDPKTTEGDVNDLIGNSKMVTEALKGMK